MNYRMNYLEFHKQWSRQGCFSIRQVYAWHHDFNRSNISQWVSKGYLVKLRNGWYAFRECLSRPDFPQYIANSIYKPSYISLQTALAHYGMIPEEIARITSVTSLKTAEFSNSFGDFTYQTVKASIMFGYMPKPMADGRTILFATPEKALADLLYLYPFYITEQDMLDIRLDENFMEEDFNREIFLDCCRAIASPALTARAETLLKAYGL